MLSLAESVAGVVEFLPRFYRKGSIHFSGLSSCPEHDQK
jgi:hypothetical protein